MEEKHIAVRWAVFRSGHGPYDDYRITAIAAAPTDRERFSASIRFLALAFHSDLEMPPQGKEVFLFWQLAPKEWALALVIDDPDLAGRRRGLEYLVLILSEEQLRQLGGTPIPVMSGGAFWSAIRRKAMAGEEEPLPLAMPEIPEIAPNNTPLTPLPLELPASQENLERLREFLMRLASAGRTIPFATWWPSNRTPPRGVFSTLLRAPSQRLPGRAETKELAATLTSELIAALPQASADDEAQRDLIHVLSGDADQLAHQVGETMRLGENLDVADWQNRTGEAAGIAARLSRNVKALAQRGGLRAETVSELARIGTEYQRLEFVLERLPSPFKPALLPEQEEDTRPAEPAPVSRKLVLALIGVVLFVSGWGLGYLTAPQSANRTTAGVPASNP